MYKLVVPGKSFTTQVTSIHNLTLFCNDLHEIHRLTFAVYIQKIAILLTIFTEKQNMNPWKLAWKQLFTESDPYN